MTKMLIIAFAIIITLGLLGSAPVSPAVADNGTAGLRWQIMMMVQVERDAVGLPPLAASVQLQQVEQQRAEDLATRHDLSHTSPDGSNVITILRADGNVARTIGEVLGMTDASDATASRAVMDAWMTSAPHREAILNPVWTRLGVGFAQDGGTRYYAVVLTD